MIDKKDTVEIGKFQKTHAIKGELNAILNLPEEYVTDMHPLIVEMDGIMVPFYAESLRPKGATSYLIKLQGIDSQESAQEMVNGIIYAPRSIVADYLDEDIMFDSDLEGFKVIDLELGEIGKVERIDDATDNILLVVESIEGNEIFIPFVEDFINEICEDDKIVKTVLPDGLIDLNIKREDDEKD